MEMHQVEYGGKSILFQLERKNVKNINLKVKRDTTVAVSASEKVTLEHILNFVKSKAPWINKHVSYFKEKQPICRLKEYVSGESFRYLGKQHRLRVVQSDVDEVKYFRGFIYMYVKDMNNIKKKDVLYQRWIRHRAEVVFGELLEKIYPLIRKYGVDKPLVRIRSMKARWGSCLPEANVIVLNLDLIKASKYCIEYVILHELVHFLYRYHDREFYNFQSVLMPDWKQRKKLLDDEVGNE